MGFGIALIVLSSISALLAGGSHELGSRADSEKLKKIHWAEEFMPGLVQQGLKHEFSPFEILDEQDRIEEILRTDPEFQRLSAARKPPISIQVENEIKRDVVKFLPKTGATDDWEAALNARANPPFGAPLAIDQISKRLDHLRQVLGGGNSKGLTTGLIQTLPAVAKKQAFKISDFNALLDFLSKNLADPVPGTFRPSHGLNLGPSKAAALARLTQLKASESELWKWFGVLSDSLTQVLARNADELATHINSQLGGNVKGVQPEEIAPWIEWLRKNSDKKVTSITEYRGQVRLIEIPPSLSIFRGCAGNDCSTSSEFAITNDPNERVFLVFGEDKKLKGYLQGTLLDVEGRPSFYIITVNGPHLSEADTKAAVAGIQRSLKEIGAEQ